MPLGKKTKYIKGQISKELWSQVKSESALVNQTMTDFITDALKTAINSGRKQREKRTTTSMAKE